MMEEQAILQESYTSSSSPPNNKATGEDNKSNSNNSTTPERNNEPVRSRWNPKPEQILILESIFNSGMVNPPKEETVRIRKLLEKFGSVGDANVFYWFQNRRSRSRRRQRQLQASLGAIAAVEPSPPQLSPQYHQGGGAAVMLPPPPSNSNYFFHCPPSSSSSSCGVEDEMLCLSAGQTMMINSNSNSNSNNLGIGQNSSVSPSVMSSSLSPPHDAPNLSYHPGLITVFINGVATEVPRGPIDMKAMFGDDEFQLFHSSGIPIPINEFGVLLQSLRHGESYFLVSRGA